MARSRWSERWAYAGLLAVATALCLALSWTPPGHEIDNYVSDFFFRLHEPAPRTLESIILGLDERTLREFGGVAGIRRALARGIELIAPAKPRAVAVDVILAEPNPEDDELFAAFARTPKLVLSSDLLPDGKWDDPIPRFAHLASGIWQVHADLDRYDAVSREIPLEKVAGRDRRWALALEAFRVSRGAVVTESPDRLEVAGITIPSERERGRLMRIRYVPRDRGGNSSGIPRCSVADLVERPERASQFAGKVVFAGLTAQTAMRDRWMTPYSDGVPMPGVEMHAQAFETLVQHDFLTDAPASVVLIWCAALAAMSGLIFALAGGARANALALLVIVAANIAPYLAFVRGTMFPYAPGVLCAVMTVATAAGWRHWITRRRLARAEASEARYQRAMQFVTHEMRTPLTAIQGSSELMTRYALPEEKRKQVAGMIHAESKRLGQMIETFLNVERLSAEQMELRRERFSASELVEDCAVRARPLAARKNIAITTDALPDGDLSGDRELMEYAVYNLLTNAVKYSPPETRVVVSGQRSRGEVRLSIEDQGIGMSKQEVRRIFERFYRTRRAEQSGEAGSGIGLSIVEQIIEQHGGSILVDSEPGKGSRFTLVLPAGAPVK